MPKFLLFFALFIFFPFEKFHSQSCATASHVCNGSTYTVLPNSGSGIPANLTVSNPAVNPQMGNGANSNAPANSGCLLGASSSYYWMILNIISPGNLGFSISDNNSPNPQSGFYDWILWPYDSTSCDAITNNLLAPLSCNWNASNTGGTGMGTPPLGASDGNYQPSIPVNAGDQFILLMDNFSNVTSLITFSSTGTAVLSCNQVYNPNILSCANVPQTYTVNSYALSNTNFTLNPGNVIQASPVFTLSSPVTQVYTITTSGNNSNNPQTVTYTSIFTYSVQSPTPINVSNQLYFCEGSAVNFTIGPQGNYLTVVSGPGGSSTFTNQQLSLGNYNYSANGIYTLNTFYAGGCFNTSTTSINISSVSAVNTTSLPPLCVGETALLSAFVPGSTSYNWVGPNAFSSNLQNPAIITSSLLNGGIYTVTAVFSHGNETCQKTGSINVLVSECVGITLQEETRLQIWPNPADNFINYTNDKMFDKIELIDFSGRITLLEIGKRINVSSFKEGIYMIKFHSQGKLISQEKIIIRRD